MKTLPQIKFREITFEENIDLMASFIYSELNYNSESKNNTNFFKNIFKKIGDLDFLNMTQEEIKIALRSKIIDDWELEMKDTSQKIISFQENWDVINYDIMTCLTKRLNITWPDDCQIIEARLGIMYSCPRFINERIFAGNINLDFNRMRELTIHEITHFLFFEKWKELYNDYNEEHYNYPNIVWYLSEALIDPLLNNETFRKYTNVDLISYPVFYETVIDGKSIIEALKKILENKTIEEGIKKSYDYFLANEKIIKGEIYDKF